MFGGRRLTAIGVVGSVVLAFGPAPRAGALHGAGAPYGPSATGWVCINLRHHIAAAYFASSPSRMRLRKVAPAIGNLLFKGFWRGVF